MTMGKHTTSHLQKLSPVLGSKAVGIPQLLDSHRTQLENQSPALKQGASTAITKLCSQQHQERFYGFSEQEKVNTFSS